MPKLDYVILDLLESTARNIKAHPLNLGGLAGGGGGVGGPPGGFIGWLPQTRVAYDEDELATLSTPASGMSLLDNLNHIRYRLGIVESSGVAGTITVIDDTTPATYGLVDTIHFSGGVIVTDLGSGDIRVTVSGGSGGSPLVVQEADGSPIVSNVDKIIFSGMTVVDNGGGDALVYPQSTYYDDRYLKLDASNDPITGKLTIQILTAGADGFSVETNGNAIPAEVRQLTTDTTSTQAGLLLQRQTTGAGNMTGNLLDLREFDTGAGTITGNFARFTHESVEVFKVTRSGSVNIPTGETYNINDIPHTHTGLVTNGDSHDHSGGDGGQIDYTTLSNLPVAETNANDIFRCDNPGGVSAFAGTIATLPGGATLTYNVTSGQEGAMVPTSTSQLAKMRLYNTTRGTSALISNCVTGTNTITLAANVPAGWATTDVITIASQTVSGGGLSWVDLEITAGLTGKTSVFMYTQFNSGTVGDTMRIHPFDASFSTAKYFTPTNALVAGTTLSVFGLQKIISNLLCLAWTGTPTNIIIREAGYLS